MDERVDVLVDRADLRRIEMRRRREDEGLRDGEVLLAVDKFAMTSNNVTYAMRGESEGFWRYFPAALPWGRIPAWGFANVEASCHDELAVGERVFGFMPMSTHFVARPARVTALGFGDSAAHRVGLFPTYNRYARWPLQRQLTSAREDLHAVLRPLFFTSFMLDDHAAGSNFFGARTLLLSSASSKTALGAAFLLRSRRGPRVCGLTSARCRDFVAATGCFDEVYAYENIDTLALEPPVAYVDFSGNARLRQSLRSRLARGLVDSLSVGATHWAAGEPPDPASSAADASFFGPAQIRKRRVEWGAEGLLTAYEAAETLFLAAAAEWLEVEHCSGLTELGPAYLRVLHGEADPARAIVVQLAAPRVKAPSARSAEERAAVAFLSPS